jgi:hypothetical protein
MLKIAGNHPIERERRPSHTNGDRLFVKTVSRSLSRVFNHGVEPGAIRRSDGGAAIPTPAGATQVPLTLSELAYQFSQDELGLIDGEPAGPGRPASRDRIGTLGVPYRTATFMSPLAIPKPRCRRF